MAAKVRPSSAYDAPGGDRPPPLSIGSKAAPAAAPPKRLRSPPRPPASYLSARQGVIGKAAAPKTPPSRWPSSTKVASYWAAPPLPPPPSASGAQNGHAARPVPSSSKPTAASDARPKWPQMRGSVGSAVSGKAAAATRDGGGGWNQRGAKSWEREDAGYSGGWDEPAAEKGDESAGDAQGGSADEGDPQVPEDAQEDDPWNAQEQEAELDGQEQDQDEQEQGEEPLPPPPEEEELADEADELDAPDEVEVEVEVEEEEEENSWDDDAAAAEDFDQDEEKEVQDEEAAGGDNGVAREGDLSVDDIPEHHREAVEGNLELKRALSQDFLNIPAAKRRKLNSGAFEPAQAVPPTASRLLREWRLERDSAAAFVVRVADPAHIERLAKSRWSPDSVHQKRSKAEQVYDQLIKIRERQGPPGGPLDAVAAFGHRWGLTARDDELLAALDHRSLRHVFREFDKSRPMAELVDEISASGVAYDDSLAVPEKPGLFVLGRSQCLELLDPQGDALVLGDANLTFSLQLAEHRKSLCHSGRTLATTFEKLETLRERYAEIDETMKSLQENGAEVLHGVDCTRLAVDPRFQGMEQKFGAVYYNFPHAGVVPGFFDGHPFVRWRHANLMHLFFRALRAFAKPGCSVKVSSNKGATGVRFSDIIGGAKASEFMHEETFPFLEWQLSRYRRSYGDRRDATKRPEDGDVYASQRAHSDMVYCFVYRPSEQPLPAPSLSYPPTREEMLTSNEGKAGRLPGNVAGRRRKVEEMWELFNSYVDGIHVG